jgi:hypothetical protein
MSSSGRFAPAVLAFLAVFLPRPATAQLVLGQYEEEAPLRTWNTFPFVPAAALGRGETTLAATGEPAAVLANPALLFSLPRFGLGLGGSLQSASLLKYGPVNTGIFLTDGPLFLTVPAADSLIFTARGGRWALAAGLSLAEIHDRPTTEYASESRGIVQYRVRFEQTGILRVFSLSAGYRLGPRWSLGLGLNYASGSRDRSFREEWTASRITITDEKSEKQTGFYLQGGVVWEPGPKLRLAAVLRAPYGRNVNRRSRVAYASPALPDGIVISGQAEDRVSQPLAVGLGGRLGISSRLAAFADLVWSDWPSYEVRWFEGREKRDFKGVLKAGLGLEYGLRFGLFGAQAEMPVRLGLSHDPQPMKTPSSSYLGVTTGLGLRWRGFRLDLGLLASRESGSGDGLRGTRAALSLEYGFE